MICQEKQYIIKNINIFKIKLWRNNKEKLNIKHRIGLASRGKWLWDAPSVIRLNKMMPSNTDTHTHTHPKFYLLSVT